MKKRTLSVGILTTMMLFSPIAGNAVEASTLAETTTQKIMWGANELADTQIGRITFLKDTKLYKRDGKNPVQFHLNAKKGSMWRVHKITKEGNMNVYDLGGGVRVQQSNLSKYEAAPTGLIDKQVRENGVHISWVEYNKYRIKYPQVRRLTSKAIEDTINNNISLLVHAAETGSFAPNGRVDYYKIVENKNNKLVILMGVSGYADDDIGGESSTELKLAYNLKTGERIE